MVYASTSSVYGANTVLPFAETDRVDTPLSLYAATKRADELMSHAYAHLFGLPQTGLRFFTVYGPWGRPDMACFSFAKAIVRGRADHLYDGGRCGATSPISMTSLAACWAARPSAHGATRMSRVRRVLNIGNHRAELVRTWSRAGGRRWAGRAIRSLRPASVGRRRGDVRLDRRDRALTGFAPTTLVCTTEFRGLWPGSLAGLND